jgi:hypothetical protein
LNGNIGVAKSVLGEITTKKNRGGAFSVFGLLFGIGMIIGPALGGMLAWPADLYPDIFGGIPLFVDNPFFLPCACSSVISLVGFIFGYFYLPETLKRNSDNEEVDIYNSTETLLPLVDDLDACVEDSYSDLDSGRVERAFSDLDSRFIEESIPLLGSIKNPKELNSIGSAAKHSIIAYCILSFQSIIFIEVFSLWSIALPPIGLGFTSKDIGLLLSSIGVIQIICQLFGYPWASRHYSPLSLYRYPIVLLVLFFIILPFIPAFFAMNPGFSKWLWPVVIFAFGVKSISENFIFTSVMILVYFLLM